jgi:uncharacterized iron-regulated membrane protein
MRAWLYKVHRWIGLSIGLLLLLQGCTGAMISFRNELNRALHFDSLHVTPGRQAHSAQSLLDLVRERHPQLQIRAADLPMRAGQAWLFRLESVDGRAMRYVSVDPFRRTVIRDATLAAWPVLWALEFHKTLLMGQKAKTVIGIEALCLLALAIIGPMLWWPGRRNLRRGFKMKLNSGFNRGVRDLHRLGGIVFALLLMVTSITGTFIIFRSTFETVVARLAPLERRPWPTVEKPADQELLPLDTVLEAARARHGDRPVVAARFPFADSSVVITYAVPANASRPRATDQTWLNGYTAEILATHDASALSPATEMFEWIVPIHSGQAFGLTGRIAFLVTGLALATLVASGFLQWNARRRAQAKKAADSSELLSRRYDQGG